MKIFFYILDALGSNDRRKSNVSWTGGSSYSVWVDGIGGAGIIGCCTWGGYGVNRLLRLITLTLVFLSTHLHIGQVVFLFNQVRMHCLWKLCPHIVFKACLELCVLGKPIKQIAQSFSFDSISWDISTRSTVLVRMRFDKGLYLAYKGLSIVFNCIFINLILF